MKLGIVTDVQVVPHRGKLVSPSVMLLEVAGLQPYFDEILIFSPWPPAFDPDAENLPRMEPGNLRVVPVAGFWPRKVYGFLLTWPQVWSGLRRVLRQADLICIRMPALCSLVGRALCRQMGIPYFITLQGDWAEQFRIARGRGGWRRVLPYFAWVPEVVTLAAARDSVVFATSRDLLERVRPVARGAYLTFNSLLEEWQLAERAKRLRREGPLRLLYVGQVAVHKGVNYAFEAMRLLAERGVEFEFHLVGDGPMVETGRAFARAHGLEGRLVFHGFVSRGPKLLEHYREADVFVFASLSEGWPKVVVEAMAAGVPLVCTAVGGVADFATDEVHGRLIRPRDARAIAEGVLFVAGDAQRYERMSEACLTTARGLTLRASVEQWMLRLREEGMYPEAGG